MCYSLAEALWLSEQNVSEDLLVAYPTADRASLQKLAANETARQRVTIMVDSIEHLDFVDAAIGPHADLRVCLELDVSWRPLPGVHIGPRRSPIHTPAQAKALAAKIVRRRGFTLVAVMAYEGQIAGLGDNPPGQPLRALGIRAIQRKSGPELVARRTAVVTAVRQVADLEFVNGGGTGSLELTGSDPSVTELAAGSGLFGPTLFDAYQAFRPEPAALFALSVVRKPTRKIATLFAGGYIASGTPTPDRQPSPYLPEGLKLVGLEGAGEVQTPVTGKAAEFLHVGDRVWLRHAKAGELFERFDEVHLVRGDNIERTVPTYRGERRNFG